MPDHISEQPPTKKCTQCGEHFPATADYFQRDQQNRDGLSCRCKSCCHEYNQRYRATHREQERERNQQYDATHREQRREQKRKYYAAHREQWHIQNREYRTSHREQIREHKREYNASHREQRRERDQRRRARKAQAGGSYTTGDMRRQYKAQQGRCWWCGQPVKWEERHEDHRIPLSKGGSNHASNLCISCAQCNLSKKDKLPHEFCGRLL